MTLDDDGEHEMRSLLAAPGVTSVPSAAVWLKRIAIASSIAVIALQWTNTRIAILKMNQFSPAPVVPSTYYVYHSMATGFRDGRTYDESVLTN